MFISNFFVGVFTFVIIGVFHPIVIKSEYYFGTRIWPVFAIAGVLALVGSIFIEGVLGVMAAIVGCSCLWSIKELFEQQKRVEKGWFPKRETDSPK